MAMRKERPKIWTTLLWAHFKPNPSGWQKTGSYRKVDVSKTTIPENDEALSNVIACKLIEIYGDGSIEEL